MMRLPFILFISILMLGTVASAADTSILPIDNIDNRSGYMSPQTLQASQGLIESAIAVNQAAEDFNNETGPLILASWPIYEYDGLGRIVKTTYENGDFVVTSYWGDTADKYQESYYGAGWIWQKTVEYWSDGVTMHYQWLTDAHTATDGDAVFYEYDSTERNINTRFDNGNFIVTKYWGETANKYTESYYKPGWIWQRALKYRPDGVTIQYEWITDAHPGIDGDDRHYEYDLSGNVIFKRLDNGDMVFSEYWGSGNKKKESYIAADWAWQRAIEYFNSTSGIINYRWFADNRPAVSGDVVFQENDSLGRMIFRRLDDDGIIVTSYWGTGNREDEHFYGAGWVWQKTCHYREADGATMHYRWMADTNPDPGDVVYEEYDPEENLIFKLYDDGTTWHI